MLTAEGCAARRERLWEALPAPCDVLVVGDPSHLIYFAGYVPSPFVFRTVESGALLLLEPGRATLVADDMLGPFLERASSTSGSPRSGTTASTRPRIAGASSSNRRSAGWRRCRAVGWASSWRACPRGWSRASAQSRPGLEIVDIGPLIRPLRRSKDPDEIEVLRRSMRPAKPARPRPWPDPAGDDRARRLPDRPEAAIEELGEPVIVYGDFASGPRCEREKGGPPTSRKIEPGDLLLLDFSVVVSGYRGDFTNTFAVGGGPTRPPARALRGVRRCPARGRGPPEARHGRPRRRCRRPRPFRVAGTRPRLHHPFGPRPGPRPPRAALFRPRERRHARRGDVVALEPGLYIEGEGGMRYERNYLITRRWLRDALESRDPDRAMTATSSTRLAGLREGMHPRNPRTLNQIMIFIFGVPTLFSRSPNCPLFRAFGVSWTHVFLAFLQWSLIASLLVIIARVRCGSRAAASGPGRAAIGTGGLRAVGDARPWPRGGHPATGTGPRPRRPARAPPGSFPCGRWSSPRPRRPARSAPWCREPSRPS